MIMLYWDMGRQIVEKQGNAKWGSSFIDQLSKDLKSEFPDMTGFSRSNLFAMKKFYLFHNQSDIIVQQLVGQIKDEQTKERLPEQKKNKILMILIFMIFTNLLYR